MRSRALQIPPVLVALDPATGQGTAIAQTDLPTQAESLAFTADGRLVVAGSDGNLYELDPVTGASTADWPDGRRGGERHEPAGLPAAVGAGVGGTERAMGVGVTLCAYACVRGWPLGMP